MSWYRIGTVSVTNGSKVVTGSGTAWAANVQAGDAFHAPDGKVYEIDFVGSDASLNIVDNYAGTTASGQSYKVQPTQGRVRDLAAAVSTLITEYGSLTAALTVLSGNVGIGVTPAHKFDLGPASGTVRARMAGVITGCAASGYPSFGYNASPASGSTWTYDIGDIAAWMHFNGGQIVFYRAPSGSAGAAITALESMRLDANGNTILTLTDGAAVPATARQMVFNRVSDTQVRLSMRGVDGTTRSTTLTLA